MISFNVGVEQNTLASNACLGNVQECVHRLSCAQDLDFICLCELGGWREGLSRTPKIPSDLTRGILPHAMCAVEGPNACLWNVNPGRRSRLLDRGTVECSASKRADMMWLQFAVSNAETHGGASQPADNPEVAGVVIGILHVISSRNSRNTLPQKKTIVQEALEILESRKTECQEKLRGLPVACFLVGDFNISMFDCYDVTAQANRQVYMQRGSLDPSTMWKAVAPSTSMKDVAIAKGGGNIVRPRSRWQDVAGHGSPQR